jgi:hypothetical protein
MRTRNIDGHKRVRPCLEISLVQSRRFHASNIDVSIYTLRSVDFAPKEASTLHQTLHQRKTVLLCTKKNPNTVALFCESLPSPCRHFSGAGWAVRRATAAQGDGEGADRTRFQVPRPRAHHDRENGRNCEIGGQRAPLTLAATQQTRGGAMVEWHAGRRWTCTVCGQQKCRKCQTVRATVHRPGLGPVQGPGQPGSLPHPPPFAQLAARTARRATCNPGSAPLPFAQIAPRAKRSFHRNRSHSLHLGQRSFHRNRSRNLHLGPPTLLGGSRYACWTQLKQSFDLNTTYNPSHLHCP